MQTFQTDRCLHGDLRFLPDGRRLLVGAQTRVLIDTLGSDPPRELQPPTGAFTAHACPVLGGTALAYTTPGDNPHLHVWEVATGRIAVCEGVGQEACDLAASPDGVTIYVGYCVPRGYEWGTKVRAFDAATLEPKGNFLPRDVGLSHLTISADGRRLAGRGSWNMWACDVSAQFGPGTPMTDVPAPQFGSGTHVEDFALSADGGRLAVATSRGLEVWDVAGGTPAEAFRSGKHRRRVSAVACSPTRPLVATGDAGGTVFLWDHAGRVQTRLDWGLGEVVALCFAPDGLRCAAADARGKVVVWDVDA